MPCLIVSLLSYRHEDSIDARESDERNDRLPKRGFASFACSLPEMQLLPTFVANAPASVASFVQRRRYGLSYLVGTVGGVYLVGKYAIRKMGEMAELARRYTLEREK